MNEKVKSGLLVLVTALLVVSLVQTGSLMNQVDALRDEMGSLRVEYHAISGNVERSLASYQNQMLEQAKPSYDEQCRILSFGAGGEARVEVTFGLKSYEPNSAVTVTAKKEGFTRAAEAKSLSPGLYSAQLSLPVKGEYTFSYSAVGDGAGIGGQLIDFFYIESELLSRLSAETLEESFSNKDGLVRMHYFPYLWNGHGGNQQLKLKNAVLTAEREGAVLWAHDLMPYVEDDGATERIDFGVESYGTFSSDFDDPLDVLHESPFYIEGGYGLVRLTLRFTDNLGVIYAQALEVDYQKSGGGTSTYPLEIIGVE